MKRHDIVPKLKALRKKSHAVDRGVQTNENPDRGTVGAKTSGASASARGFETPGFDVVARLARGRARFVFLVAVDALVVAAEVEVVVRIDGGDARLRFTRHRIRKARREIEVFRRFDDVVGLVTRKAGRAVGRRKALRVTGGALKSLVLQVDGRGLKGRGEKESGEGRGKEVLFHG